MSSKPSGVVDIVQALMVDGDLDGAIHLAGSAPGGAVGVAGALARSNRHAVAVPLLERHLGASPGDADGHHLLGWCLRRVGRDLESVDALRAAVAANPLHVGAWHLLGSVLEATERHVEAIAAFDAALAGRADLAPAIYARARSKLQIADWSSRTRDENDVEGAVRGQIRTGDHGVMIPVLMLNYFRLPRGLRLAAARHNAAGLAARVGGAVFTHRGTRPRRLSIGYLSPDLREHPVGRHLQDLFRHHRRDGFEIHAFSLAEPAPGDRVNRRIRDGVEHYESLAGLAPREAARRIHARGVKVLIDLAGYTNGASPEVLAWRPAPVQAHWFGFADTMGADFVPYVIGDEWVTGDDIASDRSEHAVSLRCSLAGTRPVSSDRPFTREDIGLPPEGFVFACFNSPHKIDPEVFERWSSILRGVPGSCLWLLADRPALIENLRSAARRRGVDPDRLVFSPRVPPEDFVARSALADLVLDTFRFTAGTTGAAVLAAGVPHLSLAGDSNAGRLGASICRAAALGDLVTESADEYERRAVELARDPLALAAMRRRTAGVGDSGLFDLPGLARQLEEVCTAMWARHAGGLEPRPIG